MHIDEIGIDRLVHQFAALSGLDAEPTARRDVRLPLQPDRHIHEIAGAVAQRKRRRSRCDRRQHEQAAEHGGGAGRANHALI
jgi:hypothetical protein